MNWAEHLTYNPTMGTLHWAVTKGNGRIPVGTIAGCIDGFGYRVVRLGGKNHKAHRIAWELANGPIPKGMQVDHINHVKSDNRLCNLRLVTCTANNHNKSHHTKNATGVIGVRWKAGGWEAKITVNKKGIYLGRFSTLFDAAAARKSASNLHGFHPNHGSIN